MSVTRLGQIGVGVEQYAGFDAKDPAAVGPHDPGVITRLGAFGVGLAKYAAFLPKTAALAPARVVSGGLPRRLRFAQRTRLAGTLVEPDQFTRLHARRIAPQQQSAALRAPAEPAAAGEFAALMVRLSYRAQARPLADEAGPPGLTARRGLPSKALLAWFLEEVA